MTRILALALVPLLAACAATGSASRALEVLEAQVAAWNAGDLEGFLAGYACSDDLMFVSSRGVTRGFEAVRERFRGAYGTRQAMGRLTFSNLETVTTGPRSAVVTGGFHVDREDGVLEGWFTVVLVETDEGMRIVLDHTSAKEEAEP